MPPPPPFNPPPWRHSCAGRKNLPPREEGAPARLRTVRSISGSSRVTSVSWGEVASWPLAIELPRPQFTLGSRLAAHSLPARSSRSPACLEWHKRLFTPGPLAQAKTWSGSLHGFLLFLSSHVSPTVACPQALSLQHHLPSATDRLWQHRFEPLPLLPCGAWMPHVGRAAMGRTQLTSKPNPGLVHGATRPAH